MPASSPLVILLRGELIGYARSKVMLVLWILMPAIAIAGYLALPASLTAKAGLPFELTATMYMSAVTSMLAGTIAAVVVAVDIVSERSRKVYDLFVIRPLRRESLIWSKFIAVFACVSIACVIAIAIGLGLDLARGAMPTGGILHDVARSLATLAGVIALSTAAGVLIGVLSRTSIVAAVILVLQVGQLLPLVPLLPGFFGVLPDQFWIVMALSFGLAALLVHGAAMMFRRAEL